MRSIFGYNKALMALAVLCALCTIGCPGKAKQIEVKPPFLTSNPLADMQITAVGEPIQNSGLEYITVESTRPGLDGKIVVIEGLPVPGSQRYAIGDHVSVSDIRALNSETGKYSDPRMIVQRKPSLDRTSFIDMYEYAATTNTMAAQEQRPEVQATLQQISDAWNHLAELNEKYLYVVRRSMAD